MEIIPKIFRWNDLLYSAFSIVHRIPICIETITTNNLCFKQCTINWLRNFTFMHERASLIFSNKPILLETNNLFFILLYLSTLSYPSFTVCHWAGALIFFSLPFELSEFPGYKFHFTSSVLVFIDLQFQRVIYIYF